MVASTKTGRDIHGVEPESQIRGRRIRGHPGHRVGRLGPRWVRIGTQFVRHLEGWYAQKHPDEDFAETFAVWLTPGSRWRMRYRNWPAIRKLRYMDRIARLLGKTQPEEVVGDVGLESDLPDLFLRKGRRRMWIRPAWEMIRQQRIDLINKIEYWTGVRRSVVRALVESIQEAAERLQLYVDTRRELTTLVELAAYATALSMSFLTRGSFVPRPRRVPSSTRRAAAGKPIEVADGETADRDRPRT